nr:polyprenyl synthetase family protein [Actinomycetota bacterium]
MSALPSSAPFSPSIGELKAMVDDELARFLETRRAALPDANPLIDEISRTIEAGGKRLRPAFCYWGFRGGGGVHGDAIVRVAASLELLHTFAVVHDDIMDESSQRRGAPTTYALHGVSFALLVGDLALVLADDSMMASGFPSEVVARAFGAYSRMRQEVIAGQYLDLATAKDPLTTEARARHVAVLKSGRYSIQEPLAIGAALAGAPPDLSP